MTRKKLVLLLLASIFLACNRTPTREEVVRDLITQRLVPDMKALSVAANALTAATKTVVVGSDLQPVRVAWREALLAWERVFVLRLGPIVDNSGLLRTRFWPLRERQLRDRLVADPALDEAAVDQLGADLRGMYALELLLFVEPAELVADSQQGARDRAALTAFAANAQHYADSARTQLGDGRELATKLSEQSQETVSKLVNQLVQTLETLASNRCATVLEMHSHDSIRLSEVVGGPSGSSRELALAQLRASDRQYRGTGRDGLSALVQPVAPEIDQRIRQRFDKALKLVSSLNAPLELAVVRDREALAEAFRSLKELEVAIKVDLASALGVTLTFTSGDGD